MGWIFIDKEEAESEDLRHGMRQRMTRSGRRAHCKEDGDRYRDGYRKGYEHGWQDKEEDRRRDYDDDDSRPRLRYV